MIKYISPSSFSLFEKDRDEFYIKYCTNRALPRMPQNKPMAVGSSFDAFVKANILKDLYGEDYNMVLGALFESQVDDNICDDGEPLRDFAIKAGARCMQLYKDYGQYSYLLTELDTTITDIHLEAGIKADIEDGHGGTFPVFGKPDIYFMTNYGPAIFDWKVNGYCSKSGVSPSQGYVRCVSDRTMQSKTHKKAMPESVWGGMLSDANQTLVEVNPTWTNQLSIYGWSLGFPPGSDVFVGIDQLAWRQQSKKPLQIATHRCVVPADYQVALLERMRRMWLAVTTGYIYYDTMNREESDTKCRQLDASVKALTERRDVVEALMHS